MKKKDLVSLRAFLIDCLVNEKYSKRKKTEILSFINNIDQSMQQKDPVQYFLILLSAAKIADFFKICVDFLKTG